MKIFLDQDGVIADFVGGASKVHGVPPPSSPIQWDLAKLWGMAEEEFWAPIDNLEFWSNLPKTPEADELVEFAVNRVGRENVAVLTAPSFGPFCPIGKRAWMRKNFPFLESRMIFAGPKTKQFIAGPGKVLIDDKDSNVAEWTKAHGIGVLCPRYWNTGHPSVKDVMRYIKARVGEEFNDV